MDKLTSLAVDATSHTSFSARARHRRWIKFVETFPAIADMEVLDLGGTPDYWESAPLKPKHVTLVNLRSLPNTDSVNAVCGDACAPPDNVIGRNYDLVVSNSLIEHVGGHAQRVRLADVIHGAARHHWVQTPYRYFPIEPHWLFPGLQFLPFSARVGITTRWKSGHRFTRNRQQAIDSVHEVDLIGITQMADYFPDSAIWREKFGGLVKSIVAIR
ncbi:class I SAM-dependent methyltransferase [Candidatus Mycolicibacterium alkanivorans]|uniref:Class I SAM-dependent methyltransferase n=1 Tax=Candidatus Mycolicibacterium alkanivorans TaxID=2954114 RepID=A0ABS9YQG1_9MYCO|nr:class I SAM-dependent methyltransferase [Candidatus Mycolicibacterium alkanivorans]MCI4673448.1 class I SAM-dependent methyltransferase [Candidatus Mycolicibacterium alkanivorans]